MAEGILRGEHLAQYGCEVELGTELHSFEQDANHVVAHLVKRVGDEEIYKSVECRWLAGADGARGAMSLSLITTTSCTDLATLSRCGAKAVWADIPRRDTHNSNYIWN